VKDQIRSELDLLLRFKSQFLLEPREGSSSNQNDIDFYFRMSVWMPISFLVPIPVWDFDSGPIEDDAIVPGGKEFLVAIYLCCNFYRSYLKDARPLDSIKLINFFDKEAKQYQVLGGNYFKFNCINELNIVSLRQSISTFVCDDDFYKDNEAFFTTKWNMKPKRIAPENRVADKQLGTKHTSQFIEAVNQGMAKTGESKKEFVERAVRDRLNALGISYE